VGVLLRFDHMALQRDIIRNLSKEMNRLSREFIDIMKFEIDSIPDSGSGTVGKDEWRTSVRNALNFYAADTANAIIRNVGITDQDDDNGLMRAMLIEFGMGTEADIEENPWIQEYKASQYYHGERNGSMRVYAREGMRVYDIDDNTWYMSNANHREEIKAYRQPGSGFWRKVFKNTAIQSDKMLQNAIDRVMDNIDFSKYLVSR